MGAGSGAREGEQGGRGEGENAGGWKLGAIVDAAIFEGGGALAVADCCLGNFVGVAKEAGGLGCLGQFDGGGFGLVGNASVGKVHGVAPGDGVVFF